MLVLTIGDIELPQSHRDRTKALDPRNIEVRFSPEVRHTLGDLAAAVRPSRHFKADMFGILRQWAEGEPPSVHHVLVSFSLLAEETFKHIRATGDRRAEEAWSDFASAMSERGFTLEARNRGQVK